MVRLGPATSSKAVTARSTSAPVWQRTNLGSPKNRYDWQRWTATIKLPNEGYYDN